MSHDPISCFAFAQVMIPKGLSRFFGIHIFVTEGQLTNNEKGVAFHFESATLPRRFLITKRA
jgi:hypothetical protein